MTSSEEGERETSLFQDEHDLPSENDVVNEDPFAISESGLRDGSDVVQQEEAPPTAHLLTVADSTDKQRPCHNDNVHQDIENEKSQFGVGHNLPDDNYPDQRLDSDCSYDNDKDLDLDGGMGPVGPSIDDAVRHSSNRNLHRTEGPKKRRNSLDMRKMPVPNLLSAEPSELADFSSDDAFQRPSNMTDGTVLDPSSSLTGKKTRKKHKKKRSKKQQHAKINVDVPEASHPTADVVSTNKTTTSATANDPTVSLLRRTCLNSKFNLRTQMMLSFGLMSLLAILLVVIVCIVVSILSGNEVNDITRQAFEESVASKEGETARYLAESLSLRLLPYDLVNLLYEATRDRFAGYPKFEDDSQVPFFDMISQSNRYPVQGPPLPLEWQMPNNGKGNVNDENQEEHVQHRFSWYQPGAPLSTENAFLFVQGICDPLAEPGDPSYLPACSNANNNMTTGGIISPTPTNSQIYRKASDLGPLLKVMYEFYEDIKEVGLYFVNGGTGATVVFPHYQFDSKTSYQSIGCNWLLEPHPYDSRNRLIASSDDHARCEAGGLHVAGKNISTRLYSPMDRAWCRNQALNPHKIVTFGPYQSAWHDKEWLMSIGRAIYDRVTNDFIGCMGVDYVLGSIEKALISFRPSTNSEITIVQWDETGTVVASSAWNSSWANETVTIDQLHVGVSSESYQQLKTLVEFSRQSSWNPTEARQAYESFHVHENGFHASAYPMPPLPDVYDPQYVPEYFVISSIAMGDLYALLEDLTDTVDDTMQTSIYLSLVAGVIGCGVIFLFILLVSHAITLPLRYMNEVSSDIVNAFGNHTEECIMMTDCSIESSTLGRCSPKTELSDVMQQFQKMVSRFSGSAMAKSMQVNVHEQENSFEMASDFERLYRSRQDPMFAYSYAVMPTKCPSNGVADPECSQQKNGCSDLVDTSAKPQRRHLGTLIHDGTKSETATFRSSGGFWPQRSSLRSPLFFWIVALIVTPLLATTVTISAYVTYNLSISLIDVIGDAKSDFIRIERGALYIHAGLRAAYGKSSMRQSMRDNYLLARYAGWLLFGALDRTDSYTYLYGGTEECKDPVFEEQECNLKYLTTCDCAWNEPVGCIEHKNDTRHQQRTKFFGMSEDSEPDGDRLETSYDGVAYSPETTEWWSNPLTVPGFEKGSNASGYDTTYDRLRVLSALPFFQTAYNADPNKTSFVGAYVVFEADGVGLGYAGCSAEHLDFSRWQSNEDNGASELRPELCPLGKYGFDPRCRGWYAKGKELALENGTGLYVTPPYHYAGTENSFGQSCTSPLVDPVTNEHVGQSVVDFMSQGIFDALEPSSTPLVGRGFPIVITGLSDSSGADVVIAPGFSLSENSSEPISDILLPHDGASGRVQFEATKRKMKAGHNGIGSFSRSTSDGDSEVLHIAFWPIHADSLVPLNSSDITRGVNVSDFLVYSLALIIPEDGLLSLFNSVEGQIRQQVYIAVAILVVVILFSTGSVIFISSRITRSMTEAMNYLLQLILYINEVEIDGNNTPEVEIDNSYGSTEVLNVVNTMETLYRIVQSANVAYFSGDVEKAYFVLSDAARLFKRLDNSKAEGVACNNLGNTMLAFYRTLEDTGADQVCGFTKREIIGKGMGYYHKAIQLGEKAYDGFYEEEGWSPNCLEFMQHLSNRYFNRAMFLLTVKNGHEQPRELEELGFRDLQISIDMDIEIVDQGTEAGWDVRGPDKMFDVFLGRIRGHLALFELGYEDKWNVDEILENAFDLVKKELTSFGSVGSPLFEYFSPAGRMQQIETELMRYKLMKGDLECAAKIAIRSLVDDDMLLQETQAKAVEVLIAYMKQSVEGSCSSIAYGASPKKVHTLKKLVNYQLWLEGAKTERDWCLSSMDEWEEDQLPETLKKSVRKVMLESKSGLFIEPTRKSKMRMSSLRASTRGDVTMEVF